MVYLPSMYFSAAGRYTVSEGTHDMVDREIFKYTMDEAILVPVYRSQPDPEVMSIF